MKFDRVLQFYRAALDNFREVSLEDRVMLNKYLNDDLINVFYKMNRMDQNHCLRVCRDVIIEGNLLKNDYELIRKIAVAALLHDVGKSQCKSNIVYKVIFVLLKPIYKKGKLRWKVANKYYEHSDISGEMVQKYDIDKMTLYLIKNHHNQNISDDSLLLLRRCDDKN